MKRNILLAVVAIFAGIMSANAADWSKKEAPLMTPWGEQLTADNVWQEYPRPQLVRDEWVNLNGVWDYFMRTATVNLDYETESRPFRSKILVPFCVESALSGIMYSTYGTTLRSTLVYRRYFSLPESFKGKDVLLHFGAVDWQCKIYVNGQLAGEHTGGSDPFSVNITPYLTADEEQELQVTVYDPCDSGGQPLGKQSSNPSGIWYTPVSGIWQTVWMEPVNKAYVERYEVVPDIDNNTVDIKVLSDATDAKATVIVKYDGKTVAQKADIDVNETATLSLSELHLWTPDDPQLYDLEISLKSSGTTTDAVKGYFAMRKFSRGMANGHPCFMLNNEPVYMYGPLDQGWWPDGLLTPPSYEAMVYDLQVIKSFGMNMVRKHIKVENDLWYEWCDRNGLIVWQDMPSGGTSGSIGTSNFIKNNFYDESVRIVNALKQHPSIGVWVVYNEGWGQDAGSGSAHTYKGVAAVRNADDDPYRLINSVTGWTDFGLGDIVDVHSYPAPGASSNTANKRVVVCGEFGGITLVDPDHLWAGSQQVYTSVENNEQYTALYNRYTANLQSLQNTNALWGSVYTQITDVEQEVNGLLTYDRKVLKVTDEQRALMRRKIEQTIHSRFAGSVNVCDAGDNNDKILWKYTTSQPDGNWQAANYDDSGWREGYSGFGTIANARTQWNSGNIWLRRTFRLNGITSRDELKNLNLRMFYDEDTEVYINGVLAIAIAGYNTSYDLFDISEEALNAIKLSEDNTIAIHCKQTAGGQYIDAGFSLTRYTPNNELDVEPAPEEAPLPTLQADDEHAYLMAYHSATNEKLMLAYSYDATTWKELNGGQPVFDGNVEGLSMRDPFLHKVNRNGKDEFHLVCTWGGDHPAIYHWQSDNLVDWTPAGTEDDGQIVLMDGKNGRPQADFCYAPEFSYDEQADLFYVYWSSRVGNNQAIYYTTTRDWQTFSTPAVYLRLRYGINDFHIQKMGDSYYAFFKDVTNGRGLCVAKSGSLDPTVETFSGADRLFASTFPSAYGPTTFPTTSGDGWLLYYISDGTEIANCALSDNPLGISWRHTDESLLQMPDGVRQGSVEIITRDQLAVLIDNYGWEKYMLLPTAETEPQEWRYYNGYQAGWNLTSFDDSSWNVGLAGFGAGTPPNTFINTLWNTDVIYLRRPLDLTGFTQEQIDAITARLYHDEDVEVYFNGKLGFWQSGYDTQYVVRSLRADALAALKPDNTNVIGIKCSQTYGGQYIDLGLTSIRPIETDGISHATSGQVAKGKGIYNMQGQRMGDNTKTLPAGIYIVDGEKVVVRNRN